MSFARQLIEMEISPVAPVMQVGARPRQSQERLQPYHETLGQAITAGVNYLHNQGAEFDEAELREPFTFDGVKYGQTKNSHVQLATYKGKPTKKFGHLTIWRDETGRYEVNVYVL